MNKAREAIKCAQDCSGQFLLSSVEKAAGRLLKVMAAKGELERKPLPLAETLNRRRLQGFLGVFTKYMPLLTLKELEVKDNPHPSLAITVGHKVVETKMAWGLGVELHKGKHMPLAIYYAICMAAREKGYESFDWQFNTPKPFVEDWANFFLVRQGAGTISM